MARARSESRKAIVPATGDGSSVSQPSGACSDQRSASSPKPGMPRAATVSSGPAETRLTRMPLRAEVAREVARGRLQRGLGDAHPVVDRPGDAGVEVEADDRPAVSGISGVTAVARSRSETAETWNAVCGALDGRGEEARRRARRAARRRSRAARRRRRPSASSSASVSAAKWSGSVTSSSSTSAGAGSAAGGALGQPPRAAEGGEDDLGALALGELGGVEGDRVARQRAGDEDALAVRAITAARTSGVEGSAPPRRPPCATTTSSDGARDGLAVAPVMRSVDGGDAASAPASPRLDLDADRVAELHRPLEDDVAHAAQRDDLAPGRRRPARRRG